MMRAFFLALFFGVSGCCTRPWKAIMTPVRVVWASGSGELRISHDKSFAILETDKPLAKSASFLYDGKCYRVVKDCGSNSFKFGYILEGE
jgi:hypothetical protein